MTANKYWTPAISQAEDRKSEYGLENQGLRTSGNVYWNLPTAALYEEALFRREGEIAHGGPLIVNTGTHTARAAKDKRIVEEDSTKDDIWWGEYNIAIAPDKYFELKAKLASYLEGRDLFVQDCFAGADPEYRFSIRIITELAWHNIFARDMFITIRDRELLRSHKPEFTVLSIPSFKADPEIDGTRSGTFIIPNFADNMCIIGGTAYGGEIKKTIFTVLNYLLPKRDVLSMHCSANVGSEGDAALFFGLSGTGKTTLSADPSRKLIGDDEHGWSDAGIFNFEGGCYAKVIRLSPVAEPEIYACTSKFGTILENVIYDPVSRRLDLDDDSRTENTRASYPIDSLDNIVEEGYSRAHPKNVIFLTCDASGVMPPISRLNPDQAMYHFISGYTSKVAGTEAGTGKDPLATFSTCFGAPFMVHHPYKYAKMLKERVVNHGSQCWLVNTGWTGGPFGVGERMSIKHTRALLNAALEGKLRDVEYRVDAVFGFEVPKECPGVPTEVLDPASTWDDRGAYDKKYRELARAFIENFKKFEEGCPVEVLAAAPKV